MRDAPAPLPPNHHGDHPGFSGVTGLLAGLTMLIARRKLSSQLADLLQLTKEDHLVDVGSGPGAPARVAGRRGTRVTGIEPASVMRGLARRLTRRSLPITWLAGVAEDLPLEDDCATALWSIATVHHWPDLDGGLAEARRVLSAGGRLLFAERRSRPGAKGLASHGWTDEQAEACAAALESAGFVDVGVERVRGGRALVVVARA